MAIDDNTVYGLTGAQVKELPEKINELKGAAKVLTTADYNWPTDNPTMIHLAQLEPGVYVREDTSVAIYPTSGTISSYEPGAPSISVDTTSSHLYIVDHYVYNGNLWGEVYFLNTSMLSSVGGIARYSQVLPSGSFNWQLISISGSIVQNSLTQTYTNLPLSAAQGKVLKGLIDTLDADLQSQIDAIVASSDVKDIVGTKADLNSYDTTTLGDNDIIKVLADESQSNATTYYRWSVSGAAFTLIGSEGPYYTKSQTDTLVNAKADASTTYTKSEVDTALNGKADNAALNNYATTAAMNTALASKANTADVYTKTQVDTALDGKADAPAAGTTYVTDTAMATALATKADTSTTYTKTEVDTALAGKASTDVATTSANGLMSSSDKTKLNNVYSMVTMLNTPTTSASAVSVPYNIRNASTGSDVSTSVTLPAATTSKAGVLTAADKVKINDMPTITMTTTDPGEGSSLAANNFVAVYSA